ncbi:MAG: biotin/lipoate A/B protein ligase family protein [Planctomycetales bacterium]
MTTVCQVMIEAEPREGAWNMALDEALLNDSLAHHTCWLRWYRWREATLSLGYFQGTQGAGIDPRWGTLPVVRRLSGGGAILHDREWTYSCILPTDHPLTHQPHDLYRLVHEGVIEVLRRHGVESHLRGANAPAKPADAFLCFERGDPNDLLFGEHKFLGSAQRRRKGAVLQHGSLILQRSPHAPEIPGLFELAGVSLDDARLVREFAPAIAGQFAERWNISEEFPSEIRGEAERLFQEKYAQGLDWNRGGSTGEISPP